MYDVRERGQKLICATGSSVCVLRRVELWFDPGEKPLVDNSFEYLYGRIYQRYWAFAFRAFRISARFCYANHVDSAQCSE